MDINVIIVVISVVNFLPIHSSTNVGNKLKKDKGSLWPKKI